MKKNLENEEAVFDARKNMRFIRNLGEGGTGETKLFYDQSIDMYFAIKKYNPKPGNDRDECYKKFVDEIKILFQLFHENIVRIYYYYLYPINKIGYIQMEYIDGTSIDNINPMDYNKKWENYFVDTINAFSYLHEKKILHRDIRAANFMIDKNGNLKIIDFGFGKKLNDIYTKNSVLLNWPVSTDPEEVVMDHEYNFSTEIYYIGKMFERLIGNEEFLYKNILSKMTEYSIVKRYSSCEEIKEDISNNLFNQIDFSPSEIDTYRNFSKSLSDSIANYLESPIFITEFEKIYSKLEKIVISSALEENIQNNQELISTFISGKFKYYPKWKIPVKYVKNFYELLSKSDNTKRKIVIDNLISRLKSIKVEHEYDDLPF